MSQNETNITEKQEKKLTEVQQNIKENRSSLEAFSEVSKEGRRFLQETTELFQGSSDAHVFEGMFEEQARLDKKAIADLELEQEKLLQESRRLTLKKEELDIHKSMRKEKN